MFAEWYDTFWYFDNVFLLQHHNESYTIRIYSDNHILKDEIIICYRFWKSMFSSIFKIYNYHSDSIVELKSACNSE